MNLNITTTRVPGGTAAQPYTSPAMQVSNAVGGVTWSISSGALPGGLAMGASTGVISGTPATAGQFDFTVQVRDSAGNVGQKQLVMVISENAPLFGSQGDPYADEGGGPDPAATLVSACGTLAGNHSYRLSGNVSAADAGSTCFTVTGSTRLDLAGFTVTGRVLTSGDPSGIVLFNGSIDCVWNGNGSDTGCIWFEASTSPLSQARLHHLTVNNGGTTDTRAIFVDWTGQNPLPPSDPHYFSMRIYHVTSSVPAQPASARSYNLAFQGARHTLEVAYNDFTCTAGAAGCQGAMCYGIDDCRMHGNRVTLEFNTTTQNGRGLLFDGGTLAGEAWNNTIDCSNNRCARVRSSTSIDIHDNVFLDIQEFGVHLGDPDTGTDDLNCTVEHNQFQVGDKGQGIFTRSSVDMFVHDNTFTCGGPLCTGQAAYARQPNAGTTTVLTLYNNPSATVFKSPQIWVEPGATVNVCNTGAAGAGPTGLGTITTLSPCPAPQ